MDEKHLDVPPTAQASADAFEILRVWVDEQQQHVNLRGSVWPDPAGWGITLAYLSTTVANAYKEQEGFDFEKVLARIRLGYEEAMKQRPA